MLILVLMLMLVLMLAVIPESYTRRSVLLPCFHMAFITGQDVQSTQTPTRDEVINKVWECVRFNNGIVALLQLIQVVLI